MIGVTAFLALMGAALAAVGGPPAAPSAEKSAGASFAAKCVGTAALLPAGVTLELAEATAPAATWLSPASPTSPQGEQVRVSMCRLAGKIDGDIGFELWLPEAWNSRLLGAGVGGEAGYFNYSDMARGVEQGFAAASSDAGHARGEDWIDDPRKVETYSHLAYHRLTQTAKAIIERFYRQPAAYSYFIGCSGGGRQGLRELQLYPGDYDGAVIGAPGLDVPLLAARLLHVHLTQERALDEALTSDDWNLIARSGVAQCDANDGLVDGIVSDPRTCGFRVRQLECRGADREDCLSPAKVAAAEAIIAPLTDSLGRTYDHGLLPGIMPRSGGLPPLPVQMFGNVVHRDENWDPGSFDIAADLPAARRAFPMMDARDPDLSAFAGRGGKLLLYHGWLDASVQPQSTIEYYEKLTQSSGSIAGDFARLYMVPGMHHCRGGQGPDRFGASEDRGPTGDAGSDMLAALIAWVERSQAPGRITARRLDPAGMTEWPLRPYSSAFAGEQVASLPDSYPGSDDKLLKQQNRAEPASLADVRKLSDRMEIDELHSRRLPVRERGDLRPRVELRMQRAAFDARKSEPSPADYDG